MRYLLLICGNEQEEARMSERQAADQHQKWDAYAGELGQTGKLLGGERLRPASSATTVRLQNGKQLLSDGPYAETKEQLGGYFLIEATDLDEAVGWASKMPHLPLGGVVEVRPIWDMGTD